MSVDVLSPGGSAELRATLRRASQVVPLAWSAGSRRFSLQAPLTLGVPAGGYVLLTAEEGTYLGQVLESEIVERAGPTWSLQLDSPDASAGGVRDATIEMPIRMIAGAGELIARVDGDELGQVTATDSFREAEVEPAPAELLERFRARTDAGATLLDVGRTESGGRARLHAQGFARHTFLCGQSGAGKTFALGIVLERLLLETDLRLVILDPNGDHVGLGQARTAEDANRTRAEPLASEAMEELLARYSAAAGGVRVHSGGHDPVRLRVAELSPETRAAVLGLHPLQDPEEYGALARLANGRESLAAVRDAAVADLSAEGRQIALRIDNLGVAGWELWAAAGERSVLDTIGGDARATVVDLSSLGTPEEQAVTASAVLRDLWRRRADRRPVLVVVDEAHNLCPAGPPIPLGEEARELIVRIAGEGRKYGLHLLMVTQRPEKLEPNALTQCDNLILLRLNGAADVERLAQAFSFVPPPLIAEAPSFSKGEAMFAGPIVPRPTRGAFEGRLSPEGGGDVPTDWAR
jgi:DNA helicase HerA-like ATPase